MDTHLGHDLEDTLRQIEAALAGGNRLCVEAAAPLARVAAQAAGHWPDPGEREMAGFGCLVAAAALGSVTSTGGEAMMINMVAMFGRSLIVSARTERAVANV